MGRWLANLFDPAMTWDGVAPSLTTMRAKVPFWRRFLFGTGR